MIQSKSSYKPYVENYVKDFIGEESYSIHTSYGIAETRHEIIHQYRDPNFGRSEIQKVTTLNGEYINEISYDDTGNMTSKKTTTSAYDEEVVSSESWTYPKGLRLRLYGFTSGELSGGSKYSYDGHDWLREKKLGGQLQIIKYDYNPRGWLSKINSIGTVSSLGASPCPEIVDIPTPDLDCDKLLEVILTFIIEYDCDKLNNGNPTSINMGVTSQSFDGNNRVGVDYQTTSIPVNGADENFNEDLPDSFSFDLTGPNGTPDISSGIYNVLLDCIQSNPNLLPILEALILQALEEEIDLDNYTPGPNNGPSSAINTTKPMFGMEIHYFDGNVKLEAPVRLNGNISWIEWQAFGETPHAYGFNYDDNNQLLQAIYGEQSEPDGCSIIKTDKYSVTGIGYDALGNIQALNRKGLLNPESVGGYEYKEIDALKYTYDNSPNKLSSITDNAELDKGFVGGSGSYSYDGTGNIEYMANKALSMEYAFNDLPVKLYNSKGKTMNYYTSTGIKLKSVIEPTTDPPIVINYFEGQEFQNSRLNSIYFQEGRATFEEFPETEDDEEYIEYFLKDHLGNTRVRIADKNNDVKVKYDVNNPQNDEFMSSHHYYPFGMEWDVPMFDGNGNSLVGSGDKTKYTYNGKEFLDKLDFNLHDYGARYYDPAIARWTAIDPLAEAYSPFSGYNYTLNNPIKYIDPNGMFVSSNNEFQAMSNMFQEDLDGDEESVVEVSLYIGEKDFTTTQLINVISHASSIYEANDLSGIASYKIVSSKEKFYNSGIGLGLTLGYEFKMGKYHPKGNTSWGQTEWGDRINLENSFINLRAHQNSDGSYNTKDLGYTLAHEVLHGLLGKASNYMSYPKRYDLSGSDDGEGHFDHFPNLLSGGTSKSGEYQSTIILYQHYIQLKNFQKKFHQSRRP